MIVKLKELYKMDNEKVETYVVIDDDVKNILPYIRPKSCIIHSIKNIVQI